MPLLNLQLCLKSQLVDHTYALSSCPFALKEGYIKAKDNVSRLQREKTNPRKRELRAKSSLQDVLMELREKNLMTEELSQRVGLYADLPLHLFEKKASEYSKEQREFAITLHLHGPKAYHYLRSTLQLPLPHPRSLQRSVTADSEGGHGELDVGSTEQQVAAFLQSKGIHLNCDNIEACHPLPRKNNSDKPAIIIRFVNRKHKIALLREGRHPKATDVYLNEHLTKRNAKMAKNARYLKKQKKIQNTWTTNCKVFIKLNGPPEEAKVLVIRDVAELVKHVTLSENDEWKTDYGEERR
ncbi:unnamed protein product [Boreogadus saida]